MLTDTQIQNKLNQLTEIANELEKEARRRWADPEAGMFYDGSYFNMMSGGAWAGRDWAKHVKFRSEKLCRMDCGAW